MGKAVCLVTGSSRGIGRSTVLEMAKSGLDVIINYYHHEKEALELKKYILDNYDVQVLCIKCDISVEEEVEEMVNEIVDHFGKIDILVNNASVCRDTLLMDKTVRDFKRILDVNLIGTYLCSKYVGKVMMENKKGKIINISSTNAIDTFYPESCDYDAAKAGVISLTHNLAREFAPFINVNCVCPGWVKTDMNKDLSIEQINEERKKILLGRFAEADEIAKIIVFLASSKANYINDAIIRVDGGKYNG
ncbi:MAG: SDR family oxidoreductase [Tenericutes bacterium]|nr:SDR family oxidoreductase [Mycoplasmatota bacterium]